MAARPLHLVTTVGKYGASLFANPTVLCLCKHRQLDFLLYLENASCLENDRPQN